MWRIKISDFDLETKIDTDQGGKFHNHRSKLNVGINVCYKYARSTSPIEKLQFNWIYEERRCSR